jgi:hypothetical protein
LSAEEFWDSTPRIIYLTFKAQDLRRDREHNDRACHSYFTAYFHRVNRMPPLSDYLIKPKGRAQTPEEMREVGRMIARAYGAFKK